MEHILITGDELREARRRAGISQSQAADLVGRSLTCWRDWEAGRRPADLGALQVFLDLVGAVGAGSFEVRFSLTEPQGQALAQWLAVGSFPSDPALDRAFHQLAEALRSLGFE